MGELDLGTLITFNPQVVTPQTSLAELLRQWSESDFHHWPVTDEDRRLLGIISVRDLDREVIELAVACPDDRQRVSEKLLARTAADVMTTQVMTISRQDSPSNALQLLLDNRIHSLPVLDNDRLVGVVTTTDFLREFSFGELPVSRLQACELVEQSVEPADCDMSLDEAAAAMLQAGVEQLGVVNGDLPLGVITSHDIRLAKCRLHVRQLLSQDFLVAGPTTMPELAAQSPTIRPGARVSDAAALMVEHRRQAVAVLTHAGRMVGAITEETVLKAMAGAKPRSALARA